MLFYKKRKLKSKAALLPDLGSRLKGSSVDSPNLVPPNSPNLLPQLFLYFLSTFSYVRQLKSAVIKDSSVLFRKHKFLCSVYTSAHMMYFIHLRETVQTAAPLRWQQRKNPRKRKC